MCSLSSSIFAGMAALALTGLHEHAAGRSQRDADHHQSGLFPQKDPDPEHCCISFPPRSVRSQNCGLRASPTRPASSSRAMSARTLSRAVTQGASAMLVKGVAGRGQPQLVHRWSSASGWTTCCANARLSARCASVISAKQEIDPQRACQPCCFAGVLLEGGIVGYDTKHGNRRRRRRFPRHRRAYRIPSGHRGPFICALISVRTGEVAGQNHHLQDDRKPGPGASAFKVRGCSASCLRPKLESPRTNPIRSPFSRRSRRRFTGWCSKAYELDLWRFEDMSGRAASCLQPTAPSAMASTMPVDIQKAVKRAGSADRDDSC